MCEENLHNQALKIIDKLERQNAVRYLSDFEQEIISSIGGLNSQSSMQVKVLKDHLFGKGHLSTPIERVAQKYGLTVDEVYEILRLAEEQIDRLTGIVDRE